MKLINKSIYIRIIILIFIVNSCSDKTVEKVVKDGLVIYYNKNKPSSNFFDISYNKLIEFNSNLLKNISISDFTLDSRKNIYIADKKNCIINKYDIETNFIKQFCRKGNGPGEVNNITNLIISDSIIIISDAPSRKMVRYDLDGNFLQEKYLHKIGNGQFFLLGSINDDLLILFTNPQKINENKYEISKNIVVLNNDFSFKNKIYSETIEFYPNKSFNPFDFKLPVANNDKNIVIAENSENIYKFDIYNTVGKKRYSVNNQYIKREFSSLEKKEIKKTLSKKSVNINGNKDITIKYKKAIKHIMIDKFDRVWVESKDTSLDSESKIYSYDIFARGIFLNTLNFNFNINFDSKIVIKLINDYICVLDKEENNISIWNYD